MATAKHRWSARALDVLLVDDEPDVRFAVSRLLESAGHRVVGEVADARRAVELATDLQPDVVVLDPLSPGGASLEVLPALAGRCPRTMIVVFSALDGPIDRDGVWTDGAFACYAKSDLPHLVTLLDSDYERFVADRSARSGARVTEDQQR